MYPTPSESPKPEAQILREIAHLTGERYTLETQLQTIDARIDELRLYLATQRKHGNAKD